MPDLGRYAVEVTLAYGVGLALLTAIVILSVVRARAVARRLDAVEKQRSDNTDGL